MTDETAEATEETGRYKGVTDMLRTGGFLADLFPELWGGDLIGAGATGVAGVVDAAGALQDGHYHQAGKELTQGAAESLAVLIPFAEYAGLLRYVGFEDFDVRKLARDFAGGAYDMVTLKGIFNYSSSGDEAPEPEAAPEERAPASRAPSFSFGF